MQKSDKTQGCQALALGDAHHERPYQAICERHARGTGQKLHGSHRRQTPAEQSRINHEQGKRNIEEPHQALRSREKHGHATCAHDKSRKNNEKRAARAGKNRQIRRGQRATAAKGKRHEGAQHIHPGRIVAQHVGEQLAGAYRLARCGKEPRACRRSARQLPQKRQCDEQGGTPRLWREELAHKKKDSTHGRRDGHTRNGTARPKRREVLLPCQNLHASRGTSKKGSRSKDTSRQYAIRGASHSHRAQAACQRREQARNTPSAQGNDAQRTGKHHRR